MGIGRWGCPTPLGVETNRKKIGSHGEAFEDLELARILILRTLERGPLNRKKV